MTTQGEMQTQGGEVLVKSDIQDKVVEDLYKSSQALAQAGDDAGKLEQEYQVILGGVKGSYKAKVLAAQLIPKYFKFFPKLHSRAINAQIDLCEEEQREVRVHAIRGLPNLCSDTPEQTINIAGVLVQLLFSPAQEDDDKAQKRSLEIEATRRAFLSLLKTDIKAVLTSFFQQLSSVEKDDKTREEAVTFFKDKIIATAEDIINSKPDVEKLIVDNVKQLIKGASESEFKNYVDVLQRLKVFTTDDGPKKLVDLLAEHSGISNISDFKPTDIDILKKILGCMTFSLPLYKNKGASNSSFFTFIVNKVLPHFDSFDDKTRLQLLHVFAESSPYTSPNDARASLPTVYSLLHKNLPTKPAEGADPDINFSYVECLLFTFHQLAQKAPGALNPICGIKIVTGQPQDTDIGDHSAKRTDLIARLKFLEQKTKEFKDILQKAKVVAVQETQEQKEKRESNNKYRTRLMNNIQALTTSLMANSPVFKKPNEVKLSWIKAEGTKRKGAPKQSQQPAAASGEPPAKKSRELYVPPSRRPNSEPTTTTKSDSGNGRQNRGRRRGGRGRRGNK